MAAKRRSPATGKLSFVHARYVEGLTIRPLDARPTAALVGGGAPLDRETHVLVASRENDTRPVAVGELTRGCDGGAIRVAVADGHRGRGIGTLVARQLAADARAAGITRVRIACDDGPEAVSRRGRIARWLRTPRTATAASG